jgi:transcription-repair coupling factor (superfamily II helicase)
MRDLEIRGTGNLLGPQQHGHIAAVGMDLYQQMLAEAISEIEGTPGTVREPPRIETGCDAYLPADYIPVEGARIGLYRRAVEADSLDELQTVAAEMTDRFGTPPRPARAFLSTAVMRWIGTELGLDSLVVEKNRLLARFRSGIALDPRQWEGLLERTGEGVRFRGRDPLTFELELIAKEPEGRLNEARNLLLTEEEAEYVTSFISLGKPAEGAENGMW